MAFKLEDPSNGIAAALRDWEARGVLKAHAELRALLIRSATQLDDQRTLLEDVSSELSAASKMRVGMMDSQSRADEVARHIKNMMTSLDQRIRALLEKPQ